MEPTPISGVNNDPEFYNEAQLLAAFKTVYTKKIEEKIQQSRYGFFGRPNMSPLLKHEEMVSLDALLMRALYNGGARTLAVMKELNWFDAQGKLCLNNPVLKESLERVELAQEESIHDMRGPV